MTERFPFWKPDLEWYSQAATKCRDCKEALAGLPVSHYEHAGGWWVSGFKRRQWLYIKCPKCGYQMSFQKMEVRGKATFEEQLMEEIRCHGHVTTHTKGFTSEELEIWLLGKSESTLSL